MKTTLFQIHLVSIIVIFLLLLYSCNIIVGSSFPGIITALGTVDKPINFVTYNPDGNPDNEYWGCIDFEDATYKDVISEFEYCNFIRGGGNGFKSVIMIGYVESFFIKDSFVSFENCLIDDSEGYGILVGPTSGFSTFENNTIKNTVNHPISIPAQTANTIGNGNTILSDSVNHGILLSGEYFNLGKKNLTWQPQTVPYVINNNLYVSGGTSDISPVLELKEGVTIAFAKNRKLSFGGNTGIVARGTQEDPVVFTSNSVSSQCRRLGRY